MGATVREKPRKREARNTRGQIRGHRLHVCESKSR